MGTSTTVVPRANQAGLGQDLQLAAEWGSLLLLALAEMTRLWEEHWWTGPLLLLIACVAWFPEIRLRRMRTWWFVYVAGIFAYSLLRAVADVTGVPVQSLYPLRLDRLLFAGIEPGVWLQAHLHPPSGLSNVDYAAVATHWSFFIVPHALAIGIFLFRRNHFPRYALAMAITMYVALIFFFLVPTAPPWLAGQWGELPAPGLARVMDLAGSSLNAPTYQSAYQSLGAANPVAAMPSVHMAITFVVYLWVRQYAPAWRWPCLAYVLVMAFSLIYLGEHYVSDLVAGAVCASIVYFATGRVFESAETCRPASVNR